MKQTYKCECCDFVWDDVEQLSIHEELCGIRREIKALYRMMNLLDRDIGTQPTRPELYKAEREKINRKYLSRIAGFCERRLSEFDPGK